MKRLLLIEFQKLYLNKASRILTLIYFLLLTSIAMIASIEFDFANIHFRIADQGIFNFPYIW
ncbi:MAG: ABC transporter permease, partial [Flavobacteriaceae bacterium]|nr:ABC transporter permease [Flavobacteriaceae bacterium]